MCSTNGPGLIGARLWNWVVFSFQAIVITVLAGATAKYVGVFLVTSSAYIWARIFTTWIVLLAFSLTLYWLIPGSGWLLVSSRRMVGTLDAMAPGPFPSFRLPRTCQGFCWVTCVCSTLVILTGMSTMLIYFQFSEDYTLLEHRSLSHCLLKSPLTLSPTALSTEVPIRRIVEWLKLHPCATQATECYPCQ